MRGQDGGRGPRSGLPRPRTPCPRVPLESGISWTVVTCRCPSGVGAGVPGWAAGRRPPASEAQPAVGVRGQPVSPSMEPLPGWSSGQAPPGPASQPLAEPRERQGDQWPRHPALGSLRATLPGLRSRSPRDRDRGRQRCGSSGRLGREGLT